MAIKAVKHDSSRSLRPVVSIVIPLLNEADNIIPLYQHLKLAMERGEWTWEIIFVDDGSTDATFKLLQEVHRHDDHVRVLRLRRNFGQTAALAAGFEAARGDTIVSLDGDLQNDPQDIARLVEKLDEGYDAVSGWRVHRQESFWLRRLPSRVANWLISHTTGVHLHDYGCTLKAYRAELVKELRLYGEMHRFIPALMWGNGARIAELSVQHRPRLNGQSKYGISRTVRVLLDLITVKFCLTSLTKPLQFFGVLGLLTSGVGMGTCLYLASMKLFWGQPLADRPFLLLGILLLVIGVQFLCVGILAEIQIRTYHEASQRPVYAIREILDTPNGKIPTELRQDNTNEPVKEAQPNVRIHLAHSVGEPQLAIADETDGQIR
jgi:glycosyltransferase involved in cell wall biosynthesis